MSESLYKKLNSYADGDYYPFHMPGHKRNACLPEYYSHDITEIDGFDDLHDAHDILMKEQEKVAYVYGSKKCFYLVNGSTCGNLSAICAATNYGDTVLAASNCHRSVFHAIELMNLKPVLLEPFKTRYGIPGQITEEDVSKKLNEFPDIKAVIITSPTYDGIVSDVEKIAHTVHQKKIPFIVDEAHGAHLGFHEAFPKNAVGLYADAVIMSLHKTLPSLTQTSLLHISGELIDEKKVEKYLDFFETSSPSYILMESISRCIDMLSSSDIYQKFDLYVNNLSHFFERTKALSNIKIISRDSFNADEAYDFDIGKIIITAGDKMSGDELKSILLNKYHLQLELSHCDYALAMTSIMDTNEGFDRLADALTEIDKEI